MISIIIQQVNVTKWIYTLYPTDNVKRLRDFIHTQTGGRIEDILLYNNRKLLTDDMQIFEFNGNTVNYLIDFRPPFQRE